MRRLSLFLLVLFILSAPRAMAQSCEGPALLSESFEGDSIPPGWRVFGLDTNPLFYLSETKGFTGKWQIYNHYGRKCAISYARFAGPGSPDDYLFLPAVSLGTGPVCLSWLSAKATPYANYSDEEYQIVISTQVPVLANLSQAQILTGTSASADQWTRNAIDLSAYQGQTVYIGFHHTGATNGFFLALDDIRIGKPVQRDAKILEVGVPDMVRPGTPVSVKGKILNGGLTELQSTQVRYQIDEGPIASLSLSNQAVLTGNTLDFQFPAPWIAGDPGAKKVRVWTQGVNNQGDQYALNDTLTQWFFVANKQKTPLHEQFTQASCPPCYVQNPRYDSLLDVNHRLGKVNRIKYQTSWPGEDPMHDLNPGDVLDKVIKHGVLFVPNVVIDGKIGPACPNYGPGAPFCITQATLDQSLLEPTIFDIEIFSQLNGNSFDFQYQVKTLADFPLTGYRVHAAVFEDSVFFDVPPGTNPTTIYPQVMRKLLPNANGMSLPVLSAGQVFTRNFSVPVLPAYNPEKLRVLVYVENSATKKIFQSKATNRTLVTGMPTTGQATGLSLFPNPGKDRVWVGGISGQGMIRVYSGLGKSLELPQKGEVLDVSGLSPGLYTFHFTRPDGSVVARKWVKE